MSTSKKANAQEWLKGVDVASFMQKGWMYVYCDHDRMDRLDGV